MNSMQGVLASLRRVLLPQQALAPHLELGARAERVAAGMLRRSKYRILGRNVRTSGGEADIVALDPDRRTIVLVEVKSRMGGEIDPQVAITHDKRTRLARTLAALRRRHRWLDRPGRIDVVTVHWPAPDTKPVVRHMVNFVSA